MRKIYSLLVITLILVSCGEQKKASVQDLVSNGTIKELRTRKAEITAKLANTNIDLKSINDAISKLDSVKKLPLITTITSKEEVFRHYLEVQGNVKTKQNILVYPEIPGILEHIYVKEGQRVSKGQVLAKIADGGLAQQVAQAKASAQLAKTTYVSGMMTSANLHSTSFSGYVATTAQYDGIQIYNANTGAGDLNTSKVTVYGLAI